MNKKKEERDLNQFDEVVNAYNNILSEPEKGLEEEPEQEVQESAPEEVKKDDVFKIIKEDKEFKTSRIQLLVKPSTKKAINGIAKKEGISVNNLINQILEQYVERRK